LAAGFVGFSEGAALIGVHGDLGVGARSFGGAALGTAVGEPGFVGLEFELFGADGAGSEGEGHASFLMGAVAAEFAEEDGRRWCARDDSNV
jgi:hypothetical protein